MLIKKNHFKAGLAMFALTVAASAAFGAASQRPLSLGDPVGTSIGTQNGGVAQLVRAAES